MKQPIYKYFLLRQKQNLYVHGRNTILKQYLFRCILKCWTYREGTAAVDKRNLFAVFTTRRKKISTQERVMEIILNITVTEMIHTEWK